MVFRWAAATACLVALACAGGESPPLERRSSALDAVATRALEEGFPGVTIAAATAEGEIRTGAAGLADRDRAVAMAPHAAIHGASTTKVVTAAAVLRLVDRGSLSLDGRLPELLAEEIWAGIPYANDITVRQLLLHTSGLYSPNNNPIYLARYLSSERRERSFWRPEEIVAFAADSANPPAFEPGAGTHYSDINFVLLGLIVEAVSGESLKEFVRREIFEPLGMERTYYLSDDIARPRARAYTVDSEIVRRIGLDPALEADEDGFVDTTDAQEQSDGAAGLITTTPDMVRFARALVKGDLVSPASRELVLEVADRAVAPGEGEALGVLRAYRMPYGVIVTAEGDGPGTQVLWAWHPESNDVVAAAINQFGSWDENDYLLNTLVPAALEAVR